MNTEAEHHFARTRAQLSRTQALVAVLIAKNKGDPNQIAEAEKNVAGVTNIIAELDAREKNRNFGRGDTVRLLAPSDTTGTVSGWASTNGMDLYRHKIMPGAFSKAIAERGLTGPKSIKLLLDHSWQHPAGVITTLEYRGEFLWIDAQLDLNVSYVKDRYSVMQMAGGFSFSVGFILEDYSFKTDAFDNEYMQIDKGDLFEVSIVLFPGNEEATMASLKGAAGLDPIIAKLARMQGLTLNAHEDEMSTDPTWEGVKVVVPTSMPRQKRRIHNLGYSPEYRAWRSAKLRCYDSDDKDYRYYGARGISMCDEWLDDFMAFYRYVGKRPSDDHSLDRIDNDGDYVPGNVRWATIEQQNNNKRGIRARRN